MKGRTQEKMERESRKRWEWEDGESWRQIGKNGRTLFNRSKPIVGYSANGRRRYCPTTVISYPSFTYFIPTECTYYVKYIYHQLPPTCFGVCYTIIREIKKAKVKQSITGQDRSWGFHEVKSPRFQDIQHMKVLRLLAICTGCLYAARNIPGTHFC
jgi:hypothetical protein